VKFSDCLTCSQAGAINYLTHYGNRVFDGSDSNNKICECANSADEIKDPNNNLVSQWC